MQKCRRRKKNENKASRKSKIMKYVKHAPSSTDFNGRRQQPQDNTT